MPFLTSSDYKTLIKDDILQSVHDNTPALLSEVELMAQTEIESYLNQRFDVANIFNKTATGRNPLIVMYMIDIVLYHLHARINPRLVPDIRKDRYDLAIDWLNKVATGRLTPDLPVLTNPDDSGGQNSRWGGNPKYSHQW